MNGVNGLGGQNYVNNQNNVGGPGDVSPPPPSGLPGPQVDVPGLSLSGVTTGVVYSQPSPLVSSQLVLPEGITDSTNVDITSCLVLLMQSAIEMRKDQREQWIVQAQNALQTSNTAADLQIEAAKSKLIAECVTTGVQAGVSIATCAVSCAEAGAGGKAEKAISSQADEAFGTDEEIKTGKSSSAVDENPEVESQAKSIISKEGLTSESLGGETVKEEGGTGKTTKSLEKEKELKTEKAATEQVDSEKADTKKADAKKASEIKEQLKAKREFKAQSMSAKSAQLQARSQGIRAALDVVGAAGKMVGAGLSYESDLDNAMAAKVKALADFQNSQARDQLDFANELRDYTNSIMSTIKDVEAARHAASNAIANI